MIDEIFSNTYLHFKYILMSSKHFTFDTNMYMQTCIKILIALKKKLQNTNVHVQSYPVQTSIIIERKQTSKQLIEQLLPCVSLYLNCFTQIVLLQFGL